MELPQHTSPICRACGTELPPPFLDLGSMPLANNYIRDLPAKEATFPLKVHVCPACWLVQVPAQARPEDIFSDYAYFSSFSATWRAHCAAYATAMTARLDLGPKSLVVEIASNDGCLLQCFQHAGIPVLGVEPARNIAAHANAQGIPTKALFFGAQTAQALKQEGYAADLIAANNVLAHVPDMHDFLSGFATLLKPSGTITFEFPHVLELLRHTQFDTIYHEHYSYLSLTAVMPVLEHHGLNAVDVERLPTHGGSLRIHVMHHKAAVVQPTIAEFLGEEAAFGLTRMETYAAFQQKVARLKQNLLQTLRRLKRKGKRVAAYGAPAKGNTLLNYCGISTDLVAYTVDANPEKQNRLLPGSHLPVYAPSHVLEDKPDVLFILPWNIAPEIMHDMQALRDWGGQFLIAVPQVELL